MNTTETRHQSPNTPAPEDDEDHEEHPPRLDISARNLAGFAVFVVLAIVALYFLLPQVAGLEETWHRLEDGSPIWLGLAVVFTVGMFAGYVLLFQGVYARAAEGRLTLRESYQVCMAGLAATRLFSAGGAGGIVLTAWAMRGAGPAPPRGGGQDDLVPRPHLPRLHDLPGRVRLRAALRRLPRSRPVHDDRDPRHAGADRHRARALDRVRADRLRAPAADARAAPRPHRALAQRLATLPATASSGIRDALHHLRSKDPALLGAIAFWACQIAVLWACFEAFGQSPPLAVLVLGFFIGMLGNLLPLPGGIGGVDGGMIGAFAAFNVDTGLAVVAVLAYRAFTFWLPTVPGVIAYLQLRKTVERWRLEGRRALHYTN